MTPPTINKIYTIKAIFSALFRDALDYLIRYVLYAYYKLTSTPTMPYVSEAQRRYFHKHRAELAKQGVNVSEWDRSTDGKALPERSKQKLHTAKSFTKESKRKK
jgi:hypothetical protein